MTHQDGARLDALLRRGASAQREPADDDPVFADVWTRVELSMDDEPAPAEDLQQRRLALIGDRQVAARRRRRATRLATAALAVAVAGGGTAAAAEYLSTRTGAELSGWEVEAGGTGEVLDLGGTDRREVFEDVTADIPFAPGYETARSWALDFHSQQVDPASPERHAITEGTLRSWMAGNAICTWADAWIAADDSDDDAARGAAATTLAASTSWEDVRANDVTGSIDPRSGADRTYFGWVPPLAAAAQAGDRAAVLDEVAYSSFCAYQVVPVIDRAPDYVYAGTR